MRLRLTLRAEGDVEGIAACLAARSPGAARRVEGQLRSALRLIAVHPYVGRERRGGVRRFAIPRSPYLIFYDVDAAADEVRVLTIRHAARREIG